VDIIQDTLQGVFFIYKIWSDTSDFKDF
jgi:hypothetical protein